MREKTVLISFRNFRKNIRYLFYIEFSKKVVEISLGRSIIIIQLPMKIIKNIKYYLCYKILNHDIS